MIPDFPETKRDFAKFFDTYLRQRVNQLSPFAKASIRIQHEGVGMRVLRADSSVSNSQMKEITGESVFKLDEIEGSDLGQVIQKLEEIAVDMVKKQVGLSMERLGGELPDSQTLNAKGRKLDAELMLEMFEKIQLDFKEDGTPKELQLVGGMFTDERLSEIDDEISSNAELRERYFDIIARKRREWRDREASRKLVG